MKLFSALNNSMLMKMVFLLTSFSVGKHCGIGRKTTTLDTKNVDCSTFSILKFRYVLAYKVVENFQQSNQKKKKT